MSFLIIMFTIDKKHFKIELYKSVYHHIRKQLIRKGDFT